MPNGKNYLNYGDDFIIGKSDPKSDIFDTIIFAHRDIESVKIPSFIKVIGDYAFSDCANLENVEFASKFGKLEIIKSNGFSATSFTLIKIPSHVRQICRSAFSHSDLETIEFTEDTELKVIERNTFKLAGITEITVPSTVEVIEKGWCMSLSNMSKFTIMPNKNFLNYNGDYILSKSENESDIFDVLIFARRDFVTAKIPSSVKAIACGSFYDCAKLYNVVFNEDSQLEIIEKESFIFCPFEKLSFPYHLTQICEMALVSCRNLKKVHFHENSQLKVAGKMAFQNFILPSIVIPPHLTDVGEMAFGPYSYLIEIPENSELKSLKPFVNDKANKEQLFMIPVKKRSTYLVKE